MEAIDLTHTIHDEIQIYPGDPIPSIRRGLTHEKDYCHVDLLNWALTRELTSMRPITS